MNMNEFDYFFNKLHGMDKDSIIKELAITENEYNDYETMFSNRINDLLSKKANSLKCGENFVQYTSYLFSTESDQSQNVAHPKAIRPIQGKLIPLPAFDNIPKTNMTLDEAIANRKSVRTYSNKYITQEELTFLLWSTQTVKNFVQKESIEVAFRNVPSAGARHPFETYLCINRVEGIDAGLYYYDPLHHGLILYKEENQANNVTQACLNQKMVEHSAITFIWVAIPYRTTWRYGQRGYRYIYQDSGHVGQNLHLAAEAIGAGACMIGAYADEIFNDLLGLDGLNEFVIYVASLGKKEEK